MVLIYGRRRIGKTLLISRFLREKGGVYLCANHEERELALRDVAEQLLEQLKLPYAPRVSSFRDLFELFAAAGVRVVVIDEFQRVWDQKLSRSGILLVLSGSAVGVLYSRSGFTFEPEDASFYSRWRRAQLRARKNPGHRAVSQCALA